MPSIQTSAGSFPIAGDGVTDDYPAFAAAIAALRPRGGYIEIPAVRCLISQPIMADDVSILFQGEGASVQPNQGTELYSPNGDTIILQNGSNGRGNNSAVRDLSVVGNYITSTGGIKMQCNGWGLDNVVARNHWAGFWQRSGIGSPSVAINANNGLADKARGFQCNYALLVEGVDSNASLWNDFDSSLCGYGIFEESFLGNTYIAPHIAGANIALRLRPGGRCCNLLGGYCEQGAAYLTLIDGGNAGQNTVRWRVGTGTILDNSGTGTNHVSIGAY